MNEFINWLYMDGHGPYVWSAYGISAVVVLFNVVSPLLKRKELVNQFDRQLRREKTQSSL